MGGTARRGIHDMGGLPAGPIDAHEHTPTLAERRIDAMMMLLRDRKRALWRTDENRRTIEAMTPEMYEGAAYYARWVNAMRSLLVEKGVLSEGEIEARLAEVKARYGSSDAASGKSRRGGSKVAGGKKVVHGKRRITRRLVPAGEAE